MIKAVFKLAGMILAGSMVLGGSDVLNNGTTGGIVDEISDFGASLLGTKHQKGIYIEGNNDFDDSDSNYEIVRVKDGDTYVIDTGDGNITVRLIGVDTPESVHSDKSKNTAWGKKISKIVKKKLKAGTKVTMEFDEQAKDKYGRQLAYVYVGKTMMNRWLVSKGYARVATYKPNVKYEGEFKALQKKAKKAKKGFWKDGYYKAFPNS